VNEHSNEQNMMQYRNSITYGKTLHLTYTIMQRDKFYQILQGEMDVPFNDQCLIEWISIKMNLDH
jgi:hypothetical protein